MSQAESSRSQAFSLAEERAGSREGTGAVGEQRSYARSSDALSEGRSIADRFRRHADALARGDRSPLSEALMRGAASDLDADGSVAKLFEGIPTPPGSVPQLRLLAALHHLVLSERAPELGRSYASDHPTDDL